MKFRELIFSKFKFQIAPLCDFPRIVHRVLIPLEQGAHLLLGSEIKIARLIAHPVLIGQKLSRLDTQQHVMGLCVLLTEIVRVVGADHGQAGLLVEL